MTEADWQDCEEPSALLEFLGSDVSDRKMRLWAVACCFRDSLWCFHAEDCRGILMSEAFADGVVDAAALRTMRGSESGERPALVVTTPPVNGISFARPALRVADLVCAVVAGRSGLRVDTVAYGARIVAERKSLAHLARDIFGSPFRSITFSPSCRTSTVVAIARQMYESRDFSAMPILADALQDAGCDSAEVLDHCRGEGPHVRGCWVVDLVFGKEQ